MPAPAAKRDIEGSHQTETGVDLDKRCINRIPTRLGQRPLPEVVEVIRFGAFGSIGLQQIKREIE